jgi:hypothetical protein
MVVVGETAFLHVNEGGGGSTEVTSAFDVSSVAETIYITCARVVACNSFVIHTVSLPNVCTDKILSRGIGLIPDASEA